MVLYISTGYRVLGIVYLNQLKGARHIHILFTIIISCNFWNCSTPFLLPMIWFFAFISLAIEAEELSPEKPKWEKITA